MREILFRGKRIDNGKWLEGYYGFDDNKPLIAINKANGINGYFVAAETVGQYTGLTDKNGKKIFEGDILKIYPDYDFSDDFDVSKVYSFNGVLCVDYYTPEYDSTALGFLCELDDVAYEVIGNIYDNPDLLEDKP